MRFGSKPHQQAVSIPAASERERERDSERERAREKEREGETVRNSTQRGACGVEPLQRFWHLMNVSPTLSPLKPMIGIRCFITAPAGSIKASAFISSNNPRHSLTLKPSSIANLELKGTPVKKLITIACLPAYFRPAPPPHTPSAPNLSGDKDVMN